VFAHCSLKTVLTNDVVLIEFLSDISKIKMVLKQVASRTRKSFIVLSAFKKLNTKLKIV